MKFIPLKNLHLQRIWWAINSPSLLDFPQVRDYILHAQHQEDLAAILLKEDENPTAVDAHFAGLGPMPMGRYFEQLLFYILARDPQYEILAENRQLFDGKITIGELDLVVRNNESGVTEHWEIALKFYLQVENNSAPLHMLGPSTKDNLQKKLVKLMEAQLPLSLKAEIQKEFPAVQAKLFVKGIFFYPWQKSACISEGVNPQHLQGAWLKLAEMEALKSFGTAWQLKTKPAWIGGEAYAQARDLLTFSEVKTACENELEKSGRPQLIALFKEEQGQWQANEHFFIVGNTWPQEQNF